MKKKYFSTIFIANLIFTISSTLSRLNYYFLIRIKRVRFELTMFVSQPRAFITLATSSSGRTKNKIDDTINQNQNNFLSTIRLNIIVKQAKS